VRILHNLFSEAPGISAYSLDLPIVSLWASASSALTAIDSLNTGTVEFSALHTATCCACGQEHQALKLFLAQADAGGGAPQAQASGTVHAEGDVPGDITTTETLAVGASVTDTIEVSGDQDWFAVELVAGQRYHITLTGTGLDPLDDPYLEVMDASGNQVRFNDDSGDGLNSSLYFVPETSGTYYINAHGWVDGDGNTSTGEYTITLEEAEPLGTYTFDEIANFITHEYDVPHRWSQTSLTYDVSGLSAGSQLLAIQALEAWEEITGLTFTEDTGNADITFQNTEEGAYASYSYTGTDSEGYRIITTATVNVASDWFGGDETLDSYTYQTFLHEIGHALGLGHAGPYNSNATYGQDNIYINDNWSYSLMSYFDQNEAGFGNYRFALGPQIADIIAIQNLYGTNPDGTRAGNTTYGFNSTETDINDWSQFVVVQPEGTYVRPPSYAIYDTGGIDTIDLSGYTRNQTLSLIPETFSSLGDRPDNNSPVYVNSVSIARGTIIENAIGGSGDDTITGNSADNTITLGAGADTYVYKTNGGADTITDFSLANDRIDLRDLSWSMATDAFNNRTSVNGGTLLTFSTGQSIFLAGIQSNQLTIDKLILAAEPPPSATEGDDVLTGTNDADVLSALGGNDEVYGLAGNDTLNGNAGNDLLDGGAGADALDGGDGFDTANYSDAAGDVEIRLWNGTGTGDIAEGDTLTRIEAVIGGAGNDFIAGNGYNNTLTGNGGNDYLVGNDGNDTLRGGEGNDTLRGGNGADSLEGGGGFDTADYSDAAGDVEIRLWNGTGTGDIAQGDTLSYVEAVIAGSGNDFLAGNGYNNTLTGNGGNDYLIGNAGNDTLRGGEGNDTLRGGSGADTLEGGGGFDTVDYSDATGGVEVRLWNGTGTGDIAQGDTLSFIEAVVGGAYDDFIAGNGFNNTLTGGYGSDFLVGNAGNDTLRGGEGNDSLRGGTGADSLQGGGGFDTVDYTDATGDIEVRLWNGTGIGDIAEGDTLSLIEAVIAGSGNDFIAGNGSNNTLTGNDGNDTLMGNSGNDTLRGGSGNDKLIGGTGNDTLSGHAGADQFVYDSGADTILDFSTSSGDYVDLTAFTSINNLSELQAYHTQSGANSVFDFGGGNTLTINNKQWSDFSADDFLFATSAEPQTAPKGADTLVSTLDPEDTGSFDFSGLATEAASMPDELAEAPHLFPVFIIRPTLDVTNLSADPHLLHHETFGPDDFTTPDMTHHDWFAV
jgi:serralysin